MATIEHPESYGWWINELESLGVIDAKSSDDNDKAELKDIAENTKEMMFKQYENAYGRQMHNNNNNVQKKVR
mgnify:CR=1 FL=1